MKFQPDKADSQVITGYGPGWVRIGFFDQGHPQQAQVAHSVVIGSKGERFDWPGIAFSNLNTSHFEELALAKPELVLLGSGSTLRFPSPSLQQALIRQGIGLEAMDTIAACRTYNILAGEGRHVLAVLLAD